MKALPIAQRINKTLRDYRARERLIVEKWPAVRQRCTQADRFSTDVAAIAL